MEELGESLGSLPEPFESIWKGLSQHYPEEYIRLRPNLKENNKLYDNEAMTFWYLRQKEGVNIRIKKDI